VFNNESINKIKMNHIKTMLCGYFALRPHGVGIEKLERLKLLQGDPLINEFDISVKEPETVSRFLGNLKHVNIPNVQRFQFQSLQKATF